jgi:hypothetical protein
MLDISEQETAKIQLGRQIFTRRQHLCHYNPRYSVLWRPFEVRLTLSNHENVLILFSLLIFVYLAVPLLVVIAKQIVTQLQEMRMGVLNWRVWHI